MLCVSDGSFLLGIKLFCIISFIMQAVTGESLSGFLFHQKRFSLGIKKILACSICCAVAVWYFSGVSYTGYFTGHAAVSFFASLYALYDFIWMIRDVLMYVTLFMILSDVLMFYPSRLVRGIALFKTGKTDELTKTMSEC